MAKSTPKPPVRLTISCVKASDWSRFKAKCKKAGVSASERIRELIAQDLKV